MHTAPAGMGTDRPCAAPLPQLWGVNAHAHHSIFCCGHRCTAPTAVIARLRDSGPMGRTGPLGLMGAMNVLCLLGFKYVVILCIIRIPDTDTGYRHGYIV